MNYEQAQELFASARDKYAGKPLPGKATRLHRRVRWNHERHDYDPCAYAIQYHATDIVTFYPDHFEITNGGWFTPTTRDKINEYAPGIDIHSERGTWYIVTPSQRAIVRAAYEAIDTSDEPLPPPDRTGFAYWLSEFVAYRKAHAAWQRKAHKPYRDVIKANRIEWPTGEYLPGHRRASYSSVKFDYNGEVIS